jgi:hypothetical protein
MNDYLTKPLRTPDLVLALDRWLDDEAANEEHSPA